jgi:hypothetical protein
VSAVTHYAPVERIEAYGESGKYRVVFAESAKEISPIPFGRCPDWGHARSALYVVREVADRAEAGRVDRKEISASRTRPIFTPKVCEKIEDTATDSKQLLCM